MLTAVRCIAHSSHHGCQGTPRASLTLCTACRPTTHRSTVHHGKCTLTTARSTARTKTLPNPTGNRVNTRTLVGRCHSTVSLVTGLRGTAVFAVPLKVGTSAVNANLRAFRFDSVTLSLCQRAGPAFLKMFANHSMVQLGGNSKYGLGFKNNW